MHCHVQLLEIEVTNEVGADIEVDHTLMILNGMCKVGQVGLAEAVMLHGQLFKILVPGDHANQLIDRVPRKQVPRDVQELQLRVLRRVEDVSADVISHFAMVEAEDLKHRKLVAHDCDAFSHEIR